MPGDGAMRIHHETALELIDQIYDSALDPAALPETLVDISEAMGCVQECLYAEMPGQDSFAVMAPRRDPDFVNDFHSYWAENRRGWTTLRAALLSMPAFAMGDIREMIDPDTFGYSNFFRSWWSKQKLGWSSMIVRFPAKQGRWGFYGVHKPLSDDALDSDEITFFRTVAPHLARAVSLQDELTSLALEEELMAADSTGTKAVVLVDATGRVLFANTPAERLLARGDCVTVDAGLLTPRDLTTTETLRRLVASCAEMGLAKGGTLALPRGCTCLPLKVEIVPFGARTTHRYFSFLGLFQPAALLVITDPEQERAARKRDLEVRFGLTPAEARFALEIVKGGGRGGAAARLGISLSTARMHLSRIFEKLGVRRQAELVRLLSLSYCDCRETAMRQSDEDGDQEETF